MHRMLIAAASRLGALNWRAPEAWRQSKNRFWKKPAQRALALLASDNWNSRALQSIATSDPVLAAELIRVANSAAFGARLEIKTLAQAIAYIGTEQACRILVSASLKRLFVAKKLHGIWNHCLDAGQIAQSLAKLARVNPEEALLAGLVHDVGRLAASLLPEEYQSRSERLLANGCTLSQVETALCGAAHAELGARALERWNFPLLRQLEFILPFGIQAEPFQGGFRSGERGDILQRAGAQFCEIQNRRQHEEDRSGR